jgi:hypothetical protein
VGHFEYSFGDYVPYDPRFKSWRFAIHDYFFCALDKIRPGGLILSSLQGNPDKVDGALRNHVVPADLLGAIRLPNDAFKKNAILGDHRHPDAAQTRAGETLSSAA